MKLQIGQRWRYTNSLGLDYLAEIMAVNPIYVKILQFNNTNHMNRFLYEIFPPSQVLDGNSRIVNGTDCLWSYLSGQDKPSD